MHMSTFPEPFTENSSLQTAACTARAAVGRGRSIGASFQFPLQGLNPSSGFNMGLTTALVAHIPELYLNYQGAIFHPDPGSPVWKAESVILAIESLSQRCRI